ncbi:MAG: TIGR00730 family Rossman fold protein [Rhodospirillaceae bacterium]|nr:TIGR00730 family Rossman fold protein [Rhodospirillaceae bacterium]
MKDITSLCVFCGSRAGEDPAYAATAEALGKAMADRQIRLVYGGGRIGIMGIVAQAVFDGGGQVTGIIPDFLMHLEVGNTQVGDLVITESMHTRKARMFELSDAIIVMPGGLGTLDEAFEIITWKQLRQHDKPIVLVNINGYWDPFVTLVESIISGGFAHEKVMELFSVVDSVEAIFPALENAPEPDQVVLTSHL